VYNDCSVDVRAVRSFRWRLDRSAETIKLMICACDVLLNVLREDFDQVSCLRKQLFRHVTVKWPVNEGLKNGKLLVRADRRFRFNGAFRL
jgi:hypothetical protein